MFSNLFPCPSHSLPFPALLLNFTPYASVSCITILFHFLSNYFHFHLCSLLFPPCCLVLPMHSLYCLYRRYSPNHPRPPPPPYLSRHISLFLYAQLPALLTVPVCRYPTLPRAVLLLSKLSRCLNKQVSSLSLSLSMSFSPIFSLFLWLIFLSVSVSL